MVAALIREDIRTDGRDEAKRLFSRLKLSVLLHLSLLLLLLLCVYTLIFRL